jgi:hypothetical protein
MTPQQHDLFGEFVRNLVQAAGAMTLYSAQHRTTVTQASRALAVLEESLIDDGTATVMHLGNELFVNGIPLEKRAHILRLMRQMKEYGIGHIIISRGIAYEEIELLLRIVTRQADRELPPTPHLQFGSVELDTPEQRSTEHYPAIPTFSAIPRELLARLTATYAGCKEKEPPDLAPIFALVGGFITALRSEANPFLALVPLREMDEYTFTHSLDVCILNLAQGMSIGLEGQLLHDVGVAAMLHDVGKLFVPKQVLDKPGALDEAEWEFMRQHTIRGAEYLLNTPGVPRLAILSAFEHHMKYDLSGYPKVSKGWRTNLCSQMTMVSDCFDALRTRRVYKEPMDFEQTAGIMLKLAGTGLNPILTFNFLRILRRMGEQ